MIARRLLSYPSTSGRMATTVSLHSRPASSCQSIVYPHPSPNNALPSGDRTEMAWGVLTSSGKVNRPSETLCDSWSMNRTRVPMVTICAAATCSGTISARSSSWRRNSVVAEGTHATIRPESRSRSKRVSTIAGLFSMIDISANISNVTTFGKCGDAASTIKQSRCVRQKSSRGLNRDDRSVRHEAT